MNWLLGAGAILFGLLFTLYGLSYDERSVKEERDRRGGGLWLFDWGLGRWVLTWPLWLQRGFLSSFGLALIGLGIAVIITES